jgi:hypothetical protein
MARGERLHDGVSGVSDTESLLRKPQCRMLINVSSTAAYLMNATNWDDEAEAYLKKVVCRDGPNEPGRGGVPCAWPTTIFELSWVITTLASSIIPLSAEVSSVLGNFLQRTLTAQKGLLGFGKWSCSYYVQFYVLFELHS